MRLSEFQRAVEAEFGQSYGRVVTGDIVLGECGDLSAKDALAAGWPPGQVWIALCRATEVPPSRWYGVGLPDPRR